MEKHSTIGNNLPVTTQITKNKVIDDNDMIPVNKTMNEEIGDNLIDNNVFGASEPCAIMDTTNPRHNSNESNVIEENHETFSRINKRSNLSSIANQSMNSKQDYSSATKQADCSITHENVPFSLSGAVDSLESSTDSIISTSTNNLTDKTPASIASRYNTENEENDHLTDTIMSNSKKFGCDELQNSKDNDNETTSKSLVGNEANENLSNSCSNIELVLKERKYIQEKTKETYKEIEELVEKSKEIIEEPISSSHHITSENVSINEKNCEIIEVNGSNEVFQIDQMDEDVDMMDGTNDKDPFGLENELTSIYSDVLSNDKVMKIVETMEVDQNLEVDESSKGTSSEDSSVKSSSENSENEGADGKVINKEIETATCIIPQSSVNNEIADKCDNLKAPRKFDITPVRLEKLMDPSKLISPTSANSEPVIPADESKNIVNISRPQREAAKKAESQIKEIVKEGNEDLPKDLTEKNTICCRCSRFRVCKWVGPGLDKYACLENCYRLSSEVKAKTTASLQQLQAIALRPVTASKVQTNGQQRSSQFPSQTQQKPILSLPNSIHYLRRCGSCGLHDIVEDKCLSWEAMDFCNEKCLSHYQNDKGSNCSFCKKVVLPTSMGKYAVRFGLEARQFCSGHCLEEFKKGLKSCSYCQKDISRIPNVVHLPAIGEKQQMKEFCTNSCKECYECLSANLPLPVIRDVCTVCNIKKLLEYQVLVDGTTHSLCSDLCFNAFNFANNITETDQCTICRKFYEENSPDSYFVFHDDAPYTLCSKICMNVFILFRRKIVPCSWCKVKKYNFDMIKRSTTDLIYVCSINCLALYQVSINAPVSRKIPCESCKILSTAQYHLTMSDASIRNFCSYNCVMSHQTQYSKNTVAVIDTKKSIISSPVPLGAPKRVLTTQTVQLKGVNVCDNQRGTVIQKSNVISNGLLPQISSASSALRIASPITLSNNTASNITPVISTSSSVHVQPKTKYVQQLIVMPPEPKEVANKNTQCRPFTATKAVSCKPIERSVETQTDEIPKYPVIVPIPVPIYVPVPLHMYTTPYPVPVPFSVPLPVPIFIPTTQKTFKGLTSKIKQILEKTPSNPYEADLLLMAEMVGNGDKTVDEVNVSDLNSHFPDTELDVSNSETNPEEDTESNLSSQDMVQKLKLASEQSNNSPSVDLEAELTSNTITAQTQGKNEESEKSTESRESVVERPRTRKRTQTATAVSVAEAPPKKRRSKQQMPLLTISADAEDSSNGFQTSSRPTDAERPPTPEKDRPDAAMCLKYTIGVRGWKQWVIQKNEQIKKAAAAARSSKKPKTFNVNILKLTTDELNYLLCKFVHEVRKPNGTEYAPDTIYYLCLSIQQYLFENGRIDNIFTDATYEPFTDVLDEVAKKFSEINDSTQFILTRVEEEHLWESKQLGAHSPHVLLATLMFFNTKYFNLATLEEHMQLSFSHILKHWKRNSSASGFKPGSPSPNRNVVLRFYPPQSALDAPNSRKKKLYEQHENGVNPLRCPVKLYEFYLSKCPESVKQRNDVFYLQPERSCVPDSPVWYSAMSLQKELLVKILHRIRMVKEVNISLLAS